MNKSKINESNSQNTANNIAEFQYQTAFLSQKGKTVFIPPNDFI